MTDKEQMSTMLEENMQRNDLTIWEQAQGFQMMLDLGETEDTIAEKTGFSKKTIRHRLNIAKLDSKTLMEKERQDGYQLSLTDLYELEKIKDVKTRDKILKDSTDSRDLARRAINAQKEQKRQENMKLYVAMMKKLGLKKAPKEADSEFYTVLAYIVCQAYRKYKLTGKIPLVFADTGTEFPEIREFVKTYTEWLKEQFPELDIELVVIRPKHSFKWVCENKGFPITSKDTAGKIRKLRHGKLSEKYRNYLLNGDKRGKFGMLAKKWQYLTDTERMPADISEYCCEALKKEPFKRYVKETGRQPFIGITQDESFRRENQYNHTGCNVYDGHTIKSQPMGFWPKNEVIQYAVEQRIPICSVYGTPYQDKKGNWYFTGEQRTGCCVCGFGCHLEPVPNRLQRLRTSDNDKHRRMCEGCLQIKNHGMTYEQALNYAGIPTEEVQEDE